jgi:2-(1,2-epoxy-1,2-dihydrophenyl)acetyl-CoA isomerase
VKSKDAVEVETGTATVRAEIRDGVGVITLDRPERRNALHPEMYEAVPALVDRFTDDNGVGCILLTASGTAFCAGGDVRDGGRRDGQRTRSLADDARMVVAMYESAKISIAALPGPAVGAGIGIALCTDLRIAAASARLVPGWGRLGLSVDFGGPGFLTRLLGPARALELLVTGSELDAASALALGLFNRVVPDDELPDAAFAWARTIAAGPPTAYRLMKENVRHAPDMELKEALVAEAKRMVEATQSEDHRRLVRAWLAAATAKREQLRQ